MKKFLKMMLVLSLLALAVSGCIFDDDDDDDANPELSGTWILSNPETHYTETVKFGNNNSFDVYAKDIDEDDSNDYSIINIAGTYSVNESNSPKTVNLSFSYKKESYDDGNLIETKKSNESQVMIYKIESSKLYFIDKTTYDKDGWDKADIYTRQ